jgi:trigger factor
MVATVGEKNTEEAEANIKSERGLRFQLIEGRAMAQSDIKITSLKDYKTIVNTWTSKSYRRRSSRNCCKSFV